MKPRSNTMMEHEGNFTPQVETRMSIDPNDAASIAAIVSMLTDMYSRPDLAAIREYSTNALDSHRAAGNPDPIEIELPSSLRPTFIVRDHGLGMSVDEITQQFSKYGWSSKRDSDTEVGMLGIGCKSGLTYTNQFSLTAIKNGVRAVVNITRDTDGVGVLQVLDTSSTDEPNGVEIHIPVSHVSAFVETANQFFGFWDPGLVLINGNPATSLFDEKTNLTLDPDVIITSKLDHDYVVMGNIPYQVDLNNDLIGYQFNIVARVEMGDVDFTPSRESLHMTARSKQTVATIREFVKDRLDRHIQAQLDAAPTHWEALKVAKEWEYVSRNRYSRSSYRGEKVPSGIPIKGQEWRTGWARGRATKTTYLSPDVVTRPTTIVVLNHPQRSMDTRTKESITDKHPDADVAYIVQHIDDDQMKWISGANLVEYEDIKPVKEFVPRKKNALDTSTWWVRRPLERGYVQDGTPSALTAPICYIMRSDCGPQKREAYRTQVGQFLDQLHLNTTVALLTATDLKRFTKKYPDAKPFQQYVQDVFAEIEAGLSDQQLLWGLDRHILQHADENTIDDPDVKELIVRIKDCISANDLNARRHHVRSRYPQLIGSYLEVALTSRQTDCKSKIPTLLKQWSGSYPMLGRCVRISYQEIEYMNALFAYRKGTP